MLLSDSERRDALWRFSKNYAPADTDWERINTCVQEVIKQRTPGRHIKVVLEDGSVRYAPIDLLEHTIREECCDLDSAIRSALGIDADMNHIDIDLKHHYDAGVDVTHDGARI
jgi:hypothetical protein